MKSLVNQLADEEPVRVDRCLLGPVIGWPLSDVDRKVPQAGTRLPMLLHTDGEQIQRRPQHAVGFVKDSIKPESKNDWLRCIRLIEYVVPWFFTNCTDRAWVFACPFKIRTTSKSLCPSEKEKPEKLVDKSHGLKITKLKFPGLNPFENSRFDLNWFEPVTMFDKDKTEIVQFVRRRTVTKNLKVAHSASNYSCFRVPNTTDDSFLKAGYTRTVYLDAKQTLEAYTGWHLFLGKESRRPPFWVRHLHITLNPDNLRLLNFSTTGYRPAAVFRYQHVIQGKMLAIAEGK